LPPVEWWAPIGVTLRRGVARPWIATISLGPLGAKVGAITGAVGRTTADAGEHRKRG
jgi:hypothetical protein